MVQRILIIDDSPTTQQFIRNGLKDEPVELLCASDGNEGLSVALAMSPDLILLDVEMPPPDGFETCRLLKSGEATKDIPIVFLTTHASCDEKVQGLDLGAIDYITKPCDKAELCARVRTALRGKYLADLLRKQAMIDEMTGIWNRAYFDYRLCQEKCVAIRHGTPLSLIFADIDRLKVMNDTYGHPLGDRVIRMVAETIAGGCRREDTACRYGGDEFAILAPQVTEAEAGVLAVRARQAIGARPLVHRAAELRITCSFGVAQFSGTDPLDLVDAADRALYRAKDQGRDRVSGAADEPAILRRLRA